MENGTIKSPQINFEMYRLIHYKYLDGYNHFRSVVAMAEYLSEANIIPPIIVVGLLHSNRMKDLTLSIEDIAYHSLNTKQFAKAKFLFKMSVSNYPESTNAFDSLGDFNMEINYKTNAINWYKKAVEIKPLPKQGKTLKSCKRKYKLS